MRNWVMSLLLLSGFYAMPSPAEEMAAAEMGTDISKIVGYNKGFYIQSPDENFRLSIGGYIQGLGFWQNVDGGNNQDTFRIRRARLKFAGHLYDPALTYELEYDFSSSKLLTTYIQYGWMEEFNTRIGQWKVPFNLESISSGSTQQFVDRSIVHAFFGVADEREIGFGVHGKLMEKQLEYEFAMMNGEGINTTNQNNEFRYVGRLTYNLMGNHGTEFCDTKQSETPQIALAAAAMYNDTPSAGVGSVDEQTTSYTGEISGKYMGLGLHTAYLFMSTDPATGGASSDDQGLLAQVGYFVMPKQLEIAARYGLVMPDAGNDQSEYTAGVNWYLHNGHRVKMQFDYSLLNTENGITAGNDRLDQRLRAQMQIKL